MFRMKLDNGSTSLRLGVWLLALLALAGCKPPPSPPAGGAPEVTVVEVRPQPVTVTADLPGRVSPFRMAQVRARVDGIVLVREFVEGSDVKAGQRLYRIDPAPYEAALASSRAALAKAQANLTTKRLQAGRVRTLLAQQAVSRQAQDDATAAHLQAQADVQAAEAELETARINLGYTEVLAPIDGHIGKSLVTEGAYVRQGEATPLATLQQLDPVYVDVAQPTAELLRLRRELEQGTLQRAADGGAAVSLVLEDGSLYPHTGTLQFAGQTVDESTGTVTVRAVFPNPARQLLPGMFVHARLQAGVSDAALLVPQQGVTFNSRGEATVMLVTADNKAEQRVIQVGRSQGNQWLVTGGLQAGDRVIVTGLQRVKPGADVRVAASKRKLKKRKKRNNINT